MTGAGSGVGQGVIKSLHASSLALNVVSADISPFNTGLYRTSESILIPKVEDSGAREEISEIIVQNSIDMLMVGSEFELAFFSRYKDEIELDTGALIVASPLETVEISNDKWLSTEFLKKNNLPYAEAYVPGNLDECTDKARDWGFPLVFKTRAGTSNRHVHIVKDIDSLARVYESVPNPMMQQLINMPSNELNAEYTCSIFKTKDDQLLGPFTARRTLKGGNSWIVEVGHFEEFHPLLTSIGTLLPSMGTLNIQLMLGDEGPVPFEFNARFSGTTAVRSYFGFNEPEMTVRSFYMGESLQNVSYRAGISFRYLEEVFLEDKSVETLSIPSSKGTKVKWF